jgi:hypothetical protein
MRFVRIINIWRNGKLPLCKKMKDWQEHRIWFFSYYGRYPTSVKQVNDFLKEFYLTDNPK